MSQTTENYTVTSEQARRALEVAFKVQRPVFLWGPPGIGKSEMVQEITDSMGGLMIDLRMAQMEPTDLRGIPFFNKDLGKMDWAPPIDLPDEELADQYPIVVLFLDEMNSAAPSVQAAGYQLILNRQIGRYKLPKNVVIVAAGNRESDKGVTYRMPMPLANRFIHIEMRPDFQSWQTWAVKNGVHTDVVGYLSFARQNLYNFDAKSADRAFPTPRSWVFVSQLLATPSIDDDDLFTLVAGAVGSGLATSFIQHRRYVGKMPQPIDILEGRVTTLDVKEISAMYSLTISMCYEMKDMVDSKSKSRQELNVIFDNFLSYIMANFDTELVIVGAKIALQTFKLPFDVMTLKNYPEFHKRFGKRVASALGL